MTCSSLVFVPCTSGWPVERDTVKLPPPLSTVFTSASLASSRTIWSRWSSSALGLLTPSTVEALICLLSDAMLLASELTRSTLCPMETSIWLCRDLTPAAVLVIISLRLSAFESSDSREAVSPGRSASVCHAVKKAFMAELTPDRLDSLNRLSTEPMIFSCSLQREELVDCFT